MRYWRLVNARGWIPTITFADGKQYFYYNTASQREVSDDDLRALGCDLVETDDPDWWALPRHQEFVNEVLKNAPESWDQDVAAESIALDYVRALEERVVQMGGTTERWWSIDEWRYDQRHPRK
jgi:hypothetical protein